MSTRVSVVIPTFNCADWLGAAIDSALQQQGADVEVIVVDDGSTDHTARLVRGYGDRVRYAYQHNAGVSAARNRGLALATGEYTVFLDADDLLLPDKLAGDVAVLGREPTVDAVYTHFLYLDGEPHHRPLPTTLPPAYDEPSFRDQLLRDNGTAINAYTFRTAAVRAVGGFDTGLHHHEDWDLYLRLLRRGRIRCDARLTALYRRRPHSAVRNRRAMTTARLRVLRRLPRYFGWRALPQTLASMLATWRQAVRERRAG